MSPARQIIEDVAKVEDYLRSRPESPACITTIGHACDIGAARARCACAYLLGAGRAVDSWSVSADRWVWGLVSP